MSTTKKDLHQHEAPPASLGDFNSAARVKEAVFSIAKQAVATMYVPPREAEFVEYDFWNRLITLQYPGETETFIVEYPGNILPFDFAGRLTPITVRVAGTHGDRYIDEVYGPAQFWAIHENSNTVVNPDGLQTYAAGSFFPNSQWPALPTAANGAFVTAPFTVRDNIFQVSEGFGTCVKFDYDTEYYINCATKDFKIDTALGGHTAAFRLTEFGVDRAVLATGTGATDPKGLVMGKGFDIEIGGETGSKLSVVNAGFVKATIDNTGYLTCSDSMIGNGLSNDSLTLNAFSAPTLTFQKINGGTADTGKIESGTDMRVVSIGGDLIFETNNVRRARLTNTATAQFSLYATGADWAVGSFSGTAMRETGLFGSNVFSAGVQNLLMDRYSTADANGQPFASWRASGTQIGSVTRATATTVAYNTSSTERWKNKIKLASDDDILELILKFKPWWYTEKADPDGNLLYGFMAEETALVAPWLVSPEWGKPGDEDYMPMGMDYGRTAAFAIGGVQALTLHSVQHRVDLDLIMEFPPLKQWLATQKKR